MTMQKSNKPVEIPGRATASSDGVQTQAPLPVLSVICCVYNEESAIPLFYGRLSQVLQQLQGSYEANLFFVDNGSEDHSYDIIRELAEQHPNVYVYALSRNFGYQCAVECGLRHTPGDLFVVIDVDCEDPPEMIPDFLKYYEEGYDIVYGERLDRHEGPVLKAARKLFYRLIRQVADENFVLDMAEFSLITAEVRDAIVQDNNTFPFIRASIGRIGFRRKNIPYKRQMRIAGKTHYNPFNMLTFAVAGALTATTLPLRLAAYLFPLWLLALGALVVAGFLQRSFWYLPVIMATGFGFCGFALVAIGVYVARVYKNGLNRPNVIIKRRQSILPRTAVRGENK